MAKHRSITIESTTDSPEDVQAALREPKEEPEEAVEVEAAEETSEEVSATAEEPGETAPPSETEAGASEEPAQEAKDNEEGEQPKAKPAPRKSRAQERIEQLAREKRELEERLTRLEARSQPTHEPPEEPKMPRASDYEDEDSYYKDLEDWQERQIDKRLVAQRQYEAQQAAQRQAARREAEIDQRFSQSIGDAMERHPDYDDAMGDVLIPRPAVDAIRRSDIGGELLYHIGKNPQEAEKLAQLDPVEQIQEIGALAARIRPSINGNPNPPPTQQHTAAQRISRAPRPPAQLSGGSAETSKDPAAMSQSEYNAWRDRTSRLARV